MKTREDTPDRLVLEDRPLLISLAIAAMIIVTAGVALSDLMSGNWGGAVMMGLGTALCGLAFGVFVRRTLVFLDRSTGLVTLREASLLGLTETQHPLADVTGVTIDTRKGRSRPGKHDPDTHRPCLTLTDGTRLPLVKVYTSGPGAARAAAQVSAWLAAGRT
jgi:hypothetical protein